MLTIIHGDDLAKSREFYREKKRQTPQGVTLEGDKITLTDLVEAIEGQSLFISDTPVFIEQLLSKKKKSKELDEMIKFLKNNNSTDIFLWESKTLDKKTLSQLPQTKVKLFTYPQTLFQFLESMRPGNTEAMLTLYHQTLQTTEIEIILFMLTKQIRTLLALSDDPSAIDETKRLASWQVGKLRSQLKYFSQKQLIDLHHKLYKLDLGSKTGALALPLNSAIDIFLSEI